MHGMKADMHTDTAPSVILGTMSMSSPCQPSLCKPVTRPGSPGRGGQPPVGYYLTKCSPLKTGATPVMIRNTEYKGAEEKVATQGKPHNPTSARFKTRASITRDLY